MNKVLTLSFLALLFSCLAPDDISISTDSDIKKLDDILKSVVSFENGYQLNKQVTLDEAVEIMDLEFDTAVIKKDLKPLLESSFSRLVRSNTYTKKETKEGVFFERKAKEKKGPILVLINMDDDEITFCEVNFESENYLYQSSQTYQLNFSQGKLDSYRISGSRKLIGLDPSTYTIEGSVRKY